MSAGHVQGRTWDGAVRRLRRLRPRIEAHWMRAGGGWGVFGVVPR
eukprot:CAMPEP_0196737354 /NCGR_PEP_ID=MMETSP1091-20130531/15119_1 /TAXON_ID=302021 /ORGANISM="Rhodomonas sp., Strain CCMP768" /LENGTH=44 /DNA_ID= /DNA_START= /DNA_END= /DNA_ORIENTATION=